MVFTKLKNYLNILEKIDHSIVENDYVEVIDFSNLTENQFKFLKSSDYFIIKNITDKDGNSYIDSNRTKFFDIGYKIPLKASRFKKIINPLNKKYKILFLQFEHKLNLYNENDVNNLFKGCYINSELFKLLFKEKSDDVYVKFTNYDSISKIKNDYYDDEICLKEFDFIFFGFIAKYTSIASLLINYSDNNKIPNLKYETYEQYHNKAYQFDLLDNLNYPYVPSILTSKLNNKILEEVKNYNFPLIIKNVYSDRGEGIDVVNNEDELKNYFSKNNNLVLIQKFISNNGEYRLMTIKNKTILIVKKDYIDVINKTNINNRKSKKSSLPTNIIDMCENISKHLFCDIIGFDIIQDINTKKYYILETNASPHFAMFSIVSGISIPEIIVDYILDKIKK
jgi:glutathione synthase/RimK-type ligase-like ATP-grasp enzyme